MSLSKEQKADIAAALILQAPPGEFKEVVADLKAIIGDDNMFKERTLKAVVKHNNDCFLDCQISGGTSASLITKYGRKADSYVDHMNKISFTYDHWKREKSGSSSISMSSQQENIVSLLKEKSQNTWRIISNREISHFNDNKDADIIVCIESHLFQPKNFWSGQLRTVYQVKTGPENWTVKGKMKSKVHYYEDGNVQMISNKKITSSFSAKVIELCYCCIFQKDDSSGTSALISMIRKEESLYQDKLIDQLNSMMESTFKALRRALPITRTKIDWGKIAGYRIGQEISKK